MVTLVSSTWISHIFTIHPLEYKQLIVREGKSSPIFTFNKYTNTDLYSDLISLIFFIILMKIIYFTF